jgi:hypothetical protein
VGHSLRSSLIARPSALLRNAPPLCIASVLRHLRFWPLAPFPWHRCDRFSRSLRKPVMSSRHALRRVPPGPHADDARTCNRVIMDPAFDTATGLRRLIAWLTFARLLMAHLTRSYPRLLHGRSPHPALYRCSVMAICRLPLPAGDGGPDLHLPQSMTQQADPLHHSPPLVSS